MKTVEEYIQLAKHSNDALNVIEQALDDENLSDEDTLKLIGVLQYIKAGVETGRSEFEDIYLRSQEDEDDFNDGEWITSSDGYWDDEDEPL